MGYLLGTRIGGGCYLLGTKPPLLVLPVRYWKTPSNHPSLWEISDLRLLTIQEAGAYRESNPTWKAADGPLRGRKGEISGLADLD